MAMNGNAMGTAVANAIIHSSAPPEVKAEVISLWQKICTEIVNHITTNGEVPAGIPVQTQGTAAAQAGQTSGPGKIT